MGNKTSRPLTPALFDRLYILGKDVLCNRIYLSFVFFLLSPFNQQLDVAEYIAQGWAKRRPLMNPLAAEFGIYTQEDLDDFIKRHLPTFALVSTSCFRTVIEPATSPLALNFRAFSSRGLRVMCHTSVHTTKRRFGSFLDCARSATCCGSRGHRLRFRFHLLFR